MGLGTKGSLGYLFSGQIRQPSSARESMLTLYSYPELFGVADNNGYGLKVFAFLRLCSMPFEHEHVFDASSAPRQQADDRRPADRRAAGYESSDHAHARRPLLGHVVFTLEG